MFWAGLIKSGNSVNVQLYRNLNGIWVLLGSAPANILTGTIRFTRNGTTLTVFLNNVQVIQTTDGNLAGGTVGIYTTANAIIEDFGATSP